MKTTENLYFATEHRRVLFYRVDVKITKTLLGIKKKMKKDNNEFLTKRETIENGQKRIKTPRTELKR